MHRGQWFLVVHSFIHEPREVVCTTNTEKTLYDLRVLRERLSGMERSPCKCWEAMLRQTLPIPAVGDRCLGGQPERSVVVVVVYVLQGSCDQTRHAL